MNDQALNPFGEMQAAPAQQGGAIAKTDQQRAVAEVQAAMAIARMNPRNQIQAMDRILNACTRQGLAAAATYTYSKGGTEVTGPSIRLAETIAQNWGNIQFGIRELDNSNGESMVQAFAWDVETNTRREVTFYVPHARFAKGKLYDLKDPREIYEMVANQGSRRLRACLLAIIPGDVVEAATMACEKTLRISVNITPDFIKEMLERFAEHGVTKEQIEKRIQRRMDTMQPAQAMSLRKIYNSLRDGMSSPAEWFEVEAAGEEAETSAREKLSSRRDGKIAEACADLEARMRAATTLDALDLLGDTSRQLPNEAERAKLGEVYLQCREKFEGK